MVNLDAIEQEFLDWYEVQGHHDIDAHRQVWVKGDVKLKFARDDLGFDFKQVTGNMWLGFKGLKSLKGLPDQVEGTLDISGNKLQDLTHCSTHVGGNLWILGMTSTLQNLNGFPSHVGGEVYVTYDPHLPMLRTLVASRVNMDKPNYVLTQIEDRRNTLQIILNDPTWMGKGKSHMLNCALRLKKKGWKAMPNGRQTHY